MFPDPKGRRRALRILGLAAFAAAVVIALTLSTRVTRGALYAGHLLSLGTDQSDSTKAISFQVAHDGRSVGQFRVPAGLLCSPASLGQARVPITQGSFTAHLAIVTAGHTEGTVTVTGRFGVLGHEMGELTVSLPARPGCDLAARYSTKT